MRKSRHIVFGAALAAALAISLQAFQLPASAADHVVRIGYQKYGNFILLKGTGALDKTLQAKGFAVAWTEFPSGPPLLEAVSAGAIDIGQTGEAPPIFAQAAGTDFVYVAHEPPAPPLSTSRTSRRRRAARRSWCRKTARSNRWPT